MLSEVEVSEIHMQTPWGSKEEDILEELKAGYMDVTS